MLVLDGAVVNIALPSMQSDLGIADSDLAWVVNGYVLAVGGLLLPGGRAGDLSAGYGSSASGSALHARVSGRWVRALARVPGR
jgi:hypothetical protein